MEAGMIKAAIDIGTNSVRLLICDVVDGVITHKTKMLEMTRIGKDVDATKALNSERMSHTVDALKKFKSVIVEKGLDTCPVFATSAVRDASNREEFCQWVKRETDFDISIISGVEEAHLGFLGVVKGAKSSASIFLVIDIGGGSTELIIGRKNGQVLYAHSLDIGAVRMTDRYQLKHSMASLDFDPVRNDVKVGIQEIMNELSSYPIESCIGIGGTITTLGAIDLNMDVYDAQRLQNHKLSKSTIDLISQKLIKSSMEEKLAIHGLMPKRADIIASGAVILDEILSCLAITEVAVSDFDNLEGSVYSDLNKKS
jgi:exopolyphosphatase/guanosine-5'-triphosphate,3'-diphosphate pyrophosphatase